MSDTIATGAKTTSKGSKGKKQALPNGRFGSRIEDMTPQERLQAITGYDLRSRIEALVAGVTGKKIKTTFHGSGACTGDDIMILPSIPQTHLFTRSEAMTLLGYAAHEISHQLETDFAMIVSIFANIEKPTKEEIQLKEWWNAIEDYRIEKLTRREFPGFPIYIGATRHYTADRFVQNAKQGLFSEDDLSNPYRLGAVGLTWVGAILNGYPTKANEEALTLLGDDLEQWLRSCSPRLAKVETKDDALQLAKDLLAELAQNNQANQQQQDQQQQDQGKSQDNSQQSSSGSSDSNQKTDDSSSGAASGSSDQDADKSGDDGQPGEKDAADGTDADKDEETTSGENSQDANDPDTSDDADQSASGNGDGKEEDSEADGSSSENGDDNSEDGAGADQESSDPVDQDQSGGESGDEGKTEEDSSGDDKQDTGDQSNSSTKSGGDQQKADSSQSDGEEGGTSEDSAGDATNSSDSRSSQQKGSSDQGGEQAPAPSTTAEQGEATPEQSDLSIDEILEVLSKIADALDNAETTIEDNVGGTEREVIQRSQKKYAQVKRTVGSSAARTSGVVRRLLLSRDRTRTRRNLEQGRLDLKRLVPIANGSPNVYYEKSIRKDVNSAVSILVDNSSSMSGEPLKICQKAAVVLDSAINGTGTDLEITGFTGSPYNPVIYQYRRFGQRGQAAAASLGSMDEVPLGGTPVAVPILEAHRRLMANKAPRKILVVISDGAAADAQRAKEAHDVAVATGCMVFGIGIGMAGGPIAQWCDNYQVINDVDQLPSALSTIVQTALNTKTRKAA